jgi:hypothetical protein
VLVPVVEGGGAGQRTRADTVGAAGSRKRA